MIYRSTVLDVQNVVKSEFWLDFCERINEQIEAQRTELEDRNAMDVAGIAEQQGALRSLRRILILPEEMLLEIAQQQQTEKEQDDGQNRG